MEAVPVSKAGLVRPGVMYLMISGAIFSFSSLLAKDALASDQVSGLEVSFWRCVFCVPCIYVYIATKVENRHQIDTWIGEPDIRKWLVVRSFFGYSGNAFLYASLQFLPIGDANIIFFSSPIWSAAIAYIFLGERTGCLVYAIIACCLSGVILTARPWEPREKERSVQGIICALLGSLAQACVYSILRKIKKLPWYTIMFPQFIIQAVIAFVVVLYCGGKFGFTPFSWGDMSARVFQECVATGVLAFVGQSCMTMGAGMEKASVSSATRTIDIPFALTFQVLYFQRSIHTLSYIGGGIVFVSVLVLAFSKEDHSEVKPCIEDPPCEVEDTNGNYTDKDVAVIGKCESG